MRIKETSSVCPVCREKIKADIVESEGKIFIEKSCVKHGSSRTLYWNDAGLYRKFMLQDYGGVRPGNPETESSKGCPLDCGLCGKHESQTVLAVVDVTQRCNLRCPVCFANAGDGADLPFQDVERTLRTGLVYQVVPGQHQCHQGGNQRIGQQAHERVLRLMGFPLRRSPRPRGVGGLRLHSFLCVLRASCASRPFAPSWSRRPAALGR